MIGYRYDSNGYLTGEIQLQESPLEPGIFLMPPNTTTTAPPQTSSNQIAKFSDESWSVHPNYSDVTYYKKSDKSQKLFELGEDFDTSYTNKIPKGEVYYVWSEESDDWILDENVKRDFDFKIKQSKIKGSLYESDYVELPSFLERKGKDIYDLCIQYRNDLRAAYHSIDLPIPQKPSEI